MNDLSIMPFGKHKGKSLIDVEDEYLLWLTDNASQQVRRNYPELFEYLAENRAALVSNVKNQKR